MKEIEEVFIGKGQWANIKKHMGIWNFCGICERLKVIEWESDNEREEKGESWKEEGLAKGKYLIEWK